VKDYANITLKFANTNVRCAQKVYSFYTNHKVASKGSPMAVA